MSAPSKCTEGLHCRLHYRGYHVGWTGWESLDVTGYRSGPQRQLASQWLGVPFNLSEDAYLQTSALFTPSPVTSNFATHADSISMGTLEALKGLTEIFALIDAKEMSANAVE